MRKIPEFLAIAIMFVGLIISCPVFASDIFDAIASHDVEGAKRLLSADPSCASRRNLQNMLPLHLAASSGDLEICKALIVAGAKVDASTDPAQATSFDAAAAQGKPVEDLSPENQSAVFRAAGLTGGFTALHLASRSGHKSVVEYLLSIGADANRQDPLKETALHMAINQTHPDIALLLISKGANVSLRDYKQYTALHAASDQRQPTVVQALINAKAEVNASTESGITPLLLAADCSSAETFERPCPKEESLKVARLLVSAGADVNAKEKELGYTPLISATRYQELGIVRLLLENKANPNVKMNTDSTALDVADVLVEVTYDDDGKPTPEHKEAVAIQAILKKHGSKSNKPWNPYEM